jgi:2-polyprenyl-6-methoxyphenol hydroxylase-like FAD-dependent oxidoreductase
LAVARLRSLKVNEMMRTAEALVIGGGPVGLFAAVCLLDRGASVQVLDATHERVVRGYACGLHPATSRAFDRVGLMPAVLEIAHRIDRLSIRRGVREIGTAEFAALQGGHPYALSLRQSDLEELLEDAVERRGGAVSRHPSVTELSPREGCARVTSSVGKGELAAPSGEAPSPAIVETDADYVIRSGRCFHAARAIGIGAGLDGGEGDGVDDVLDRRSA